MKTTHIRPALVELGNAGKVHLDFLGKNLDVVFGPGFEAKWKDSGLRVALLETYDNFTNSEGARGVGRAMEGVVGAAKTDLLDVATSLSRNPIVKAVWEMLARAASNPGDITKNVSIALSGVETQFPQLRGLGEALGAAAERIARAATTGGFESAVDAGAKEAPNLVRWLTPHLENAGKFAPFLKALPPVGVALAMGSAFSAFKDPLGTPEQKIAAVAEVLGAVISCLPGVGTPAEVAVAAVTTVASKARAEFQVERDRFTDELTREFLDLRPEDRQRFANMMALQARSEGTKPDWFNGTTGNSKDAAIQKIQTELETFSGIVTGENDVKRFRELSEELESLSPAKIENPWKKDRVLLVTQTDYAQTEVDGLVPAGDVFQVITADPKDPAGTGGVRANFSRFTVAGKPENGLNAVEISRLTPVAGKPNTANLQMTDLLAWKSETKPNPRELLDLTKGLAKLGDLVRQADAANLTIPRGKGPDNAFNQLLPALTSGPLGDDTQLRAQLAKIGVPASKIDELVTLARGITQVERLELRKLGTVIDVNNPELGPVRDPLGGDQGEQTFKSQVGDSGDSSGYIFTSRSTRDKTTGNPGPQQNLWASLT
jgi:hypothetical protein